MLFRVSSIRSILWSTLSIRVLMFLILCCLSCISAKIWVNIRFDWGLRAQVDHIEHLLVVIDPLHHLLRVPGEAYQAVIHHWPGIYLILSYFFFQNNDSILALLLAHLTSRSYTPARFVLSKFHTAEACCYPDIWSCVAWCNEANWSLYYFWCTTTWKYIHSIVVRSCTHEGTRYALMCNVIASHSFSDYWHFWNFDLEHLHER